MVGNAETRLTLHHVGFACTTIEAGLQFIKQVYDIEAVTDAVFDPFQNATVCMIETANGLSIELVVGRAVGRLLDRGVSLYHLAYAVNDIDAAIRNFAKAGGRQIGEVVPAKLFNGSRVCFVQTQLGMVELVETGSGNESGNNRAGHRSEKPV
jgi:predicted enzyme related to lactoylglutathione lyase